MKNFIIRLRVAWHVLAHPLPANGSVTTPAPQFATPKEVISKYEDVPYPMLPKQVVYKAVDGGFPFMGSLGPENVLDIRFFRALACELEGKQKDLSDGEDPAAKAVDVRARDLAHKTYDFYLDFFTLPPDDAQTAAEEFWLDLLK